MRLLFIISLLFAYPILGNEFSLSPSEISVLSQKSSQGQITPDDLHRWDQVAIQMKEKSPLGDGENVRLLAYLCNAQQAFAEASYALTGTYAGSLDPISEHVFQLFYPDYRLSQSKDPYSTELTAQLVKKIDARFNAEQAGIHAVKVPAEEGMWVGKEPYIGIKVPTFKPWFIGKSDRFRCQSPPGLKDPEWQILLAQVKSIASKATEKQKQVVLAWAGMTKPVEGNWIVIAGDYMRKNQVPLNKQLNVRSKLSAALCDTLIAAFDSKYVYCIKRPDMMDKTLKTVIPTPNHPSYPSIHSTEGGATATLLTYYFPDQWQEWTRLAEEAGMTRLWGGIHYTIDHFAGKAMGVQIGLKALTSEKENHPASGK